MRHLQERILLPHRRKTLWQHAAVNDVSLQLRAGEWVGLYGPNGCGKTTLLRMLAGILSPDAGRVRCDADLSCFFELSVGFHEERTAAENVRMHGLLQGLSRADLEYVMEQTRDFAGIDDHWDLPMKCYSTGMRMRLGFAVATAAPGDVLLLDEILAVGDADFQSRCKRRLADLRHSGRSAIIVSHSLGDLEKMCDRVLLMDQGHIVSDRAAASV